MSVRFATGARIFIVLNLIFLFQILPQAFADQKKDFTEVLKYHIPNFRLLSTSPSPDRHSMTLVEGWDGRDLYEASIYDKTLLVYQIKKNGDVIYNWSGIKVIGHRSNTFEAPENTLAAMERAVQLGVDILEMDVRETKDGELVILHDETVDRTTNGKGYVKDLTLAEIKKLDAGGWFSSKFAGEKVPTLREALQFIAGRALPDIDFKSGNLYKLTEILRDADLLGSVRVTFSASKEEQYKLVKDLDPGYLIRPTGNLGLITLNSTQKKYQPEIISLSELEISKTLMRALRRRGLKAFTSVVLFRFKEHWRLNRAINATSDYIQADDTVYLLQRLRELHLHP